MDYEVQAAVSALGYLDGEEYRKEADCFETVKDLIRYLRRDGENRSIRKHLGESNIVENDLVPILTKFSDDLPLFDATLRLLINLTQPTAQCFNGKIPSDSTNRQIFIDVNNHLKHAKRCFTKEALYLILFTKLDNLLKLDWENRQEEDKITIERLLILIKNILSIPPAEEDQRRTDTDITLHDQILWAIHRTGVENLILSICESDDERQFHLITLEIVALMVKDHKPEELARAGSERSEAEKIKDEGELNKVYEMERAQKFANLKRFSGRHTNFSGSYVVHGLKSIVDNNDVVSHKVVTKTDRLTMDERKKRKKPAKNRAPLPAEKTERKSALTIRLILKDFCHHFLERCYNYFSTSVRQLLGRNDRRQHSSEFYFMNLTRFFIEFSRYSRPTDLNDLKYVLESITIQTFHYVLMQMIDCMEMMKAEKFEAVTWGKRLHNALKTYKELFTSLAVMEKSSNEEYIDIAMEIKKHVFYVVEYGEFFVNTLKDYNAAHLSKSCLSDLIECVNIYMKIFESHCLVHGGGIKVQKKKRKRKSKKKNNKKTKLEEEVDIKPPIDDELLEQKEDSWELVTSSLSDALQGHLDLPTDVVPFDPVAEHGFDEKIVAKVRIQESLKKGQTDVAVALLKASRELWFEEHESFGSEDVEPEDEFMILRNIFFAELPKIVGENCDILNDQQQKEDEEDDEEKEDDQIMEEELEDANDIVETKEVELTFETYLQRFAHCDVLTWYIWILNDFETNSMIVNHSILKLFHRICYQLKSPGFLYQARLFRVFQKVASLPSYKNLSSLKELVEFARHFLNEFFVQAFKNRKLFVEILFRKNYKEIHEMEYGYGTFKAEKVKKGKREKSKNKSRKFIAVDGEEPENLNDEIPMNDGLFRESKHTSKNFADSDDDELENLNDEIPIGDGLFQESKNKSRKFIAVDGEEPENLNDEIPMNDGLFRESKHKSRNFADSDDDELENLNDEIPIGDGLFQESKNKSRKFFTVHDQEESDNHSNEIRMSDDLFQESKNRSRKFVVSDDEEFETVDETPMRDGSFQKNKRRKFVVNDDDNAENLYDEIPVGNDLFQESKKSRKFVISDDEEA